MMTGPDFLCLQHRCAWISEIHARRFENPLLAFFALAVHVQRTVLVCLGVYLTALDPGHGSEEKTKNANKMFSRENATAHNAG